MINYDVVIDYGNNEPVQAQLVVDADIADWYKFQNQECYRLLMEYLRSAGTPYTHSLPDIQGGTRGNTPSFRKPNHCLRDNLLSAWKLIRKGVFHHRKV